MSAVHLFSTGARWWLLIGLETRQLSSPEPRTTPAARAACCGENPRDRPALASGAQRRPDDQSGRMIRYRTLAGGRETRSVHRRRSEPAWWSPELCGRYPAGVPDMPASFVARTLPPNSNEDDRQTRWPPADASGLNRERRPLRPGPRSNSSRHLRAGGAVEPRSMTAAARAWRRSRRCRGDCRSRARVGAAAVIRRPGSREVV